MKNTFMRRFQVSVIFLLLFFQFATKGQAAMPDYRAVYHALRVGDTVPDFAMNNLINYKGTSEKISAFNGKLVILDFWSSYCASCIEAFPKMENLQKQFGDSIQIVLVNAHEDEQKVKSIFKKRKELTGLHITLPAVCGDSNIAVMFPYSGLPQEVWIDGTGKVLSITYPGSVNPKNIRSVLHHKIPSMPQKDSNDDIFSAEWNEPLFKNGNGGNGEDLMYQSLLSKGVKNLFPETILRSDSVKGYFVTCANASIRDLYRMAFSDRRFLNGIDLVQLPISHIILEVEDTSRFVNIIDSEYADENLYVYQLLTPKKTEAQIQRMMQDDLQRYFGLEAGFEDKKVPCLVLTAEDTMKIRYTQGGKTTFFDANAGVRLNNVPLSYFIRNLEDAVYYYSRFPIVDETGFKGMLGDFMVDCNLSDYNALDHALKKYKMRFQLQERSVRLLVIREMQKQKE